MASGNAPTDTTEESALRDFLILIRRRLPVVLAMAVLVPSAALVFSLRSHKEYTATAKLLFRDPGFDQKLFGSSVLGPSRDPDRQAATNVSLVSLDLIALRAAQALRNGFDETDIQRRVTVTSEGQADVVAVKARDSQPGRAAALANTVAQEYILFRRDADRSKIDEAIAQVRRQLRALSATERKAAQGRLVVEQIAQLRILSSLQTGNAELVQPAEPPRTASSPRPVRDTLLGLFVGLLLGIALAILLQRLDRRLHHQSEAEAIFDRPVLGVVPESRTFRDQPLLLAGIEGEAFRAIRTNLRFFAVDQDVPCLLVTSSAAGEGKSTTARYLAATAAASGVSVVLLEADLRRPVLARLFRELRENQGLTNVLAGEVPLADVIQQLPLARQTGATAGPSLDVVVAGPAPPNPTDMLDSDRMQDVLAELRHRYDLVVVDTSPVRVVPDAVPLLHTVGGVAVVIRTGRSTRADVLQLRKQFEHLGVTALGIIINGAPPEEIRGYYGYEPSNTPQQPGRPTRDARSWVWVPLRRARNKVEQ